ncbi:MAG: 3-dehydroquinate synthase [wastewater metagenome]|nr:3-dehydroquinate synthase [Candidatus Loosdrechtia aerotolerans]
MKIQQRIRVEFDYKIYFTHDLFNPENIILKEILKNKQSKVLIFLDSGVASSWPDIEYRINAWFDAHPLCARITSSAILLDGGEQCKNDFQSYKEIAYALRMCKLDRHSYVIIIGGGAVLDTVGFIASISQRGIRHIRIPTTVLSQNDSGVGVKNGINFFGVKNYFGTYTPPYAVINDFDFLKTLDIRDWLSGISEAFKVAIIKDRSFLEYLVSSAKDLAGQNIEVMETLIMRCVRLHTDHIITGNDPFENGSSRPLDFGHWSGHYLEIVTDFELRHGEAVAIGIVLDMTIARNRGLVTEDEYDLVYRGLRDCGFTLWHSALEKRNSGEYLCVYYGLEEFRQHLGGKLTLIMPDHLGHSCQINSISYKEIEQAVYEVKNHFYEIGKW